MTPERYAQFEDWRKCDELPPHEVELFDALKQSQRDLAEARLEIRIQKAMIQYWIKATAQAEDRKRQTRAAVEALEGIGSIAYKPGYEAAKRQALAEIDRIYSESQRTPIEFS